MNPNSEFRHDLVNLSVDIPHLDLLGGVSAKPYRFEQKYTDLLSKGLHTLTICPRKKVQFPENILDFHKSADMHACVFVLDFAEEA